MTSRRRSFPIPRALFPALLLRDLPWSTHPLRKLQVLRCCLSEQQQIKESEPNHEQKVPVDGTQIHAQTYLGGLDSVPHFGRGPAPGDQAAQEVQPMQRGDQVEEGVSRVGVEKITGSG